MRVGLVVFANKWTGAGAVAELYCRALQNAGLNARLLFVDGRNLERRLAGSPWAWPGLVKERSPRDFLANIRAVRALAEDVDVVICHLPHDHLLCVAAGVHRRVPLVRAFRNPRHIRRDPFHRALNRGLTAVLCAYSALEAEIQRTVGWLPSATLRVPVEDRFTPVDGSGCRTRFGLPTDAPVIGAVGKLAAGRGFELLLKAASRLESQAHLVVVGHGELLTRLQNLAAVLGIGARAHWVGYQDEALPELYSAMDLAVFVAPGSDWGHRAISEAQACARPVVAVSAPGVEDLIEDGVTGQIVGRDPTALAAAVDSLVADAASTRRLGQTAAAASSRRLGPTGDCLAQFLDTILPTCSPAHHLR